MTNLSESEPESARSVTFCGLSISFDHEVLEPRLWTQAQSDWAAELLPEAPPGPVLELCAGAGQIGLGAVRGSCRNLVLVDNNPAAHRFALMNAAANGLASHVEARLARIDTALQSSERFALIVADPPWVPTHQTSRFPEDPVLAIDGGDDGLDLARSCVDVIDRHLADGGSALLQVGTTAQANLIAAHALSRVSGRLHVVETRAFDRGVIIQLAR